MIFSQFSGILDNFPAFSKRFREGYAKMLFLTNCSFSMKNDWT